MTTLAQYRSAISSKVGLDNTTAGDQGFIDAWVNEGVVDVTMRTDCIVQSAILNLTAGTGDYTIDAAILKIKRAYTTSVNANFDMTRVSADDIIEMRNASTDSVSPAQYYAFQGTDLFMIYPTPTSDDDTVTFYYVPRPSVLSASSDSPDFAAEYHKAVEFYALREAADFSDDGTSQMGMAYLQMYEQWIKRIKKWMQFTGGHKLPLATVRSSNARLPFHDRSRYP